MLHRELGLKKGLKKEKVAQLDDSWKLSLLTSSTKHKRVGGVIIAVQVE